ncbi:MAG: helix-turn-helix domain-containing protein [Acidobacteria bacterium]|nr:helix-turn-helix domain-containing protein [Acidobacteriota bacterium]
MTPLRIKRVRKQLGLSQDEFARRLGVARVTVTRWENGSRKPGSIAARAIRSTLTPQETQGWHSVSQAALNEIWDNPEDAIYDNWQARFGAKAR